MGVLALFNPPSAPDFDVQQTRVAEMLAKRSTIIIQAQYDTSTGLMTRQAFERQATGLLGADGADSHIILYLDIDRLHVINETFGMHVGDDVIVSVAERMARTLPPERAVGAHFRRPASRRSSPIPAWKRARWLPNRFAPPPRVSCRAPARAHSKYRYVWASRP